MELGFTVVMCREPCDLMEISFSLIFTGGNKAVVSCSVNTSMRLL